jgi:DNA-binding NarL/FixJ family response regulator
VAAQLKVLIADDDALARRAVRDTLQAEGMAVPADVGNGLEAVELALHYRPDVVVMDVLMPGVDGIQATREITNGAPEVRVVLLTASTDEDLGLLGLRAGAVGFLSKELDLGTLPEILRGVARGEAAVSRHFTLFLIERLRELPEAGRGMRPVRSPLSDREWEVLDLLCEDRSTGEIADELVLSVETVRSHVKSVLRKLGVSSRADAAREARRLRRPAPDHG